MNFRLPISEIHFLPIKADVVDANIKTRGKGREGRRRERGEEGRQVDGRLVTQG